MSRQIETSRNSTWLIIGLILVCLSCLLGNLFPKPIPKVHVHGRVADPQGASVPFATVFLCLFDSDHKPIQPVQVLFCDRKGEFQFERDRTQTFVVGADRKGIGMGLFAEGDGDENVVRLIRGSLFRPRFVDSSGRPMKGVRVQPMYTSLAYGGLRPPRNLFQLMSRATDSDGGATFEDVPVGRQYAVEAASDQYAEVPIFNGRHRSRNRSEFRTMLVPSCKINGIVTKYGQPVAGAMVYAAPGPRGGSVLTDGHGRFSIDRVPEGAVEIEAVPWNSWQGEWACRPALVQAQRDVVASAEVHVEEGASVSVKLVGTDGAPKSAVRLSFAQIGDKRPQRFIMRLNPDGALEIRLLAGKYRVKFAGSKLGPIVDVKDGQDQTVRIVVPAGAEPQSGTP